MADRSYFAARAHLTAIAVLLNDLWDTPDYLPDDLAFTSALQVADDGVNAALAFLNGEGWDVSTRHGLDEARPHIALIVGLEGAA